MISSLNLRKFQPWCQNPYPTHTEGFVITRTICGGCVCAKYIRPEQRQCCHEILQGFKRRATRAAPKGGDDHRTDARLSLSTQWPNYRFKRGLS